MRIGATVTGAEQLLLNALADANAAAVLHSLRLATGAKIIQPSQDPAAFVHIASLESRLSHVDSTLTNVESASNVVAQIQLALDGLRTQLETIRSTLEEDEDLALTAEERLEKQAEIDDALSEIDQLATSEIEGRRRLDGSTNYRTAGLNPVQVRQLQVFGVRETAIRGTVTTRAERASLTYTGAAAKILADATFTLTGDRGSASFAVELNDDLDDVADEINQQSHQTGITAAASGDTLTFTTVDYGTDAIIEVDVDAGTFNVTGGNGDGTAQGVDAVATINDETLTADGNRFTYNRNGLRFAIEFQGGFKGGFSPITVSDADVDQFALSTRAGDLDRLGLPGLQMAALGGLSGSLDQLLTGGTLAGLGENTSQAIRVVDESLSQLSLVEGMVNGFADQTIAASSALLNGFSDSMLETLEIINGISEEEESLLITKNQQLADSALASLSLLADQRASIVSLLKNLAGL